MRRALLVVLLAVSGASAPAADADRGPSMMRWEREALRQLVVDLSREHGLDPRLMDALVRVESDYDHRAVSRKGAMGLMQLMPSTARRLSVADPFDPEANVRGGMREFQRLLDLYSGDVVLALAAYNAGEGAVSAHRGVPPYAETRGYVRRIMSLYTGRPFATVGGVRSVPVRLVRDPSSGRKVITNVSSRSAAPDGGRATLGGGFGQTAN